MQQRENLNSLVQKLNMNEDDLCKWSSRALNRDYYAQSYEPDQSERYEVEQLAKRFSSAGLQNKTNEHIYNTLLSLQPSSSAAAVQIKVNDKPKSVILKREPVISHVEGRNETIVELILLNHSFIISLFSEESSLHPTSVSQKEGGDFADGNNNPNHERKKNEIKQATNIVIGMTKNFSKSVNVLLGKKTIECCFDLKSIVGIKIGGGVPMDEEATQESYESEGETTFTLLVKDDKKNILHSQFTCDTVDRKDAWIKAFEVSVMQNYEMEENSLLAAALCNNMPSIITSVESNTLQIDEIDAVHGFTSLHFAIINNNLDIAAELLKGGADTNIKSRDGFSPLYYAKVNANLAAISLLQKFGAKDFTPIVHHAHNQTAKVKKEQSMARMRINSNDSDDKTTGGIESSNTFNLYANELSFEEGTSNSKSNKQLKQKTKKIISGVTNLIAGLSERGTIGANKSN
mmetsp:Transcript_5966/g.7343  ORF Transcript_5966/g.7343 Transcript_5966/m.7343 type:complete len:461 (+) Transcript_5966:80-1462(+)